MRNYLEIFKQGMTCEQYLEMMTDQAGVYKLHFDRVKIPDGIPDIPSLKILIISEPGCGDSSAILPVIRKIFENRPVELRVILRSEHPEVMDDFLTNGGRSIPVIIVLDAEGNLIFRYGPRPRKAQDIFEEHRQAISQGLIEKPEVMKKIRHFYSADRGKAIVEEFLSALVSAVSVKREV